MVDSLARIATALEAIAAIECWDAVPPDRMPRLAIEWSRIVGQTSVRLRRELHERAAAEADVEHLNERGE
jgi:hypothetical protein